MPPVPALVDQLADCARWAKETGRDLAAQCLTDLLHRMCQPPKKRGKRRRVVTLKGTKQRFKLGDGDYQITEEAEDAG